MGLAWSAGSIGVSRSTLNLDRADKPLDTINHVMAIPISSTATGLPAYRHKLPRKSATGPSRA